MPLFKRLLTSSAALLFALTTVGCGGLFDQLQSSEVALATLLRTPDATNPATEEVIAGETAFTLFFGSVDKGKLVARGESEEAEDGAFKGNAGAKVTLRYKNAAGADERLDVPDLGEGKYGLTSGNSALTYNGESAYVLDIVFEERTYRLRVEPPAKAEIAEFKDLPKRIVENHPAGKDFVVTRAAPAQDVSKNPLAFVNLTGLNGTEEADTWSNMPEDGMGFLRFVLADAPWRQNSFTIPGEHFVKDAQYLVTLSSLARGTSDGPKDGTSALFPGSSFLAGVADAGGVLTEGQTLPEEPEL